MFGEKKERREKKRSRKKIGMKSTAWRQGHSPTVSGLVFLVLRPVAECVVQINVCSQGWRAHIYLYSEIGPGGPQDMQTVSVRLFIHALGAGGGICRRTVHLGAASIQSEGRRSLGGSQGGSQGLYVWRWGWRRGGVMVTAWGQLALVAVPLPGLLHTPLQSRLLTPNSHQRSLGGGRRPEAGTRGWSGGRREGGRVSGRQAG